MPWLEGTIPRWPASRDRDGGGIVSLPVAVADSAPAYRRGLSLALERAGFAPVEEPDDLVAWAGVGGCRALLLTVRSASDWEPARCLAESNPELVLVVLLVDPTSDRHAEALRTGARGVTAWDATPEAIVEVLAAAVRGYALLPSGIASAMARGQPPFFDPDWVTAEEIDWLRLLAGGATIHELADKVGYSERAFYRILHGLYGRMRVSSRTEAILQARRWGLLS